MANRQIDPSGAFNRGHDDAANGMPRNCPYFDTARVSDYRNGYNAAKLADRSPA